MDISWKNDWLKGRPQPSKYPAQLRVVPIGLAPSRFFAVPKGQESNNPLTPDQYMQIVNDYGPQYAIAMEIISDEIKKGNSMADAINSAISRTENIDNTILQELIGRLKIRLEVE